MRLIHDVQKHGFHIVGTQDDDDPRRYEYGFTVGCYYSFGIPEAVLYGLQPDNMHALFWDYLRWAKRRPTITPGTVTADLANLPILLREVDLSWYQPILGYGTWFYHRLPRPFPCLQLAWPDRDGRFDTDPEYDGKFRAVQPDLSVPYEGV